MGRIQVSKGRYLGHSGKAFLPMRRSGISFSGFFVTLMLAAPSGVVLAADLPATMGPAQYQPPPAEFSWSGIYAGINVGGGVDHFGFKYYVNTPQSGGFQQGTAGITSLGPLGGLQVGFNYELPFFHIVASIEIDNSAAGISGQTSVNNILGSGAPFSATFASRVDDFGTARLRLGYAWGRFLPYLTAGFTFGVIETSFHFSTPGFLSSVESTAVRSGVFPHVGNGGMGIEYAIDSHFTMKTEYLYEFINARRVSFSPGDGTTVSFGTRTMYHIIRLGLNYKFDFLSPLVTRY
jgi:outer membrane immunogenic protein